MHARLGMACGSDCLKADEQREQSLCTAKLTKQNQVLLCWVACQTWLSSSKVLDSLHKHAQSQGILSSGPTLHGNSAPAKFVAPVIPYLIVYLLYVQSVLSK